MKKEGELTFLIENMDCVLNEGVYVFCAISEWNSDLIKLAVCHFKEAEGITIVLKKEVADEQNLPYEFKASWITLRVQSALNAVGLTAAIASNLSEKGISCNVIAGFYHDHIFVPSTLGREALNSLNSLSNRQ